ncbi:hypothetical protein TNCV_117001 [Trichonephila clavipes]|nr:hypothetical protein TNCV_117001 [Trichonephila clavipes]
MICLNATKTCLSDWTRRDLLSSTYWECDSSELYSRGTQKEYEFYIDVGHRNFESRLGDEDDTCDSTLLFKLPHHANWRTFTDIRYIDPLCMAGFHDKIRTGTSRLKNHGHKR